MLSCAVLCCVMLYYLISPSFISYCPPRRANCDMHYLQRSPMNALRRILPTLVSFWDYVVGYLISILLTTYLVSTPSCIPPYFEKQSDSSDSLSQKHALRASRLWTIAVSRTGKLVAVTMLSNSSVQDRRRTKEPQRIRTGIRMLVACIYCKEHKLKVNIPLST